MKKNYRDYLIGILIALGFYFVSMTAGSVFNVLVSFAAGYESYGDFKNSDNIAGFIVILLIGLANHVFMAWITTVVMGKYGKKNACATKWFFRSAAIAVIVFAVIVIPLIYAHNVGWLVWLTHSLGIALFGKRQIDKIGEKMPSIDIVEASNDKSATEIVQEKNALNTTIKDTSSNNKSKYIFCHKCGTKLKCTSQFCHKCGTKIVR